MTSKAENPPANPERALTPETMGASEKAAAADHHHEHTGFEHTSPLLALKYTWPIFFSITAAIALAKWSAEQVETIDKSVAAGHITAPKGDKGHGGGGHGHGGGGGHH